MTGKPPRLGLFITEEMDKALRDTSKDTRIPKSDLVRMALEAYLSKEYGYKFTDRLEWGGSREKGE